ncbi:MAG TPA: LysR family transcriptional regulator [Thermoplasmata archaeon]|nr:LysR family transcriptional regulator [Thermoplasmata archaeon]
MAIWAEIADSESLSAAARALDLPKQTVSRRLQELERALGVQLLQRTTRRLKLTEAGRSFAQSCREIVRIRDEATRMASTSQSLPKGPLRITSDVLLGERFIAPLVDEFLLRYPETRVDFIATRRFLDLVEEGIDLAFWIGHPEARSLMAFSLGPAQIRYCASPSYLERRGRPTHPRDLKGHDCIELLLEEVGSAWPFLGTRGLTWVRTSRRLRTNSYSAMYQAALAGIGIALFPAFAVVDDIRNGRLEPVLDDLVPALGNVEMVSHRSRPMTPQAAAFADLVRSRFARSAPWVLRRSGSPYPDAVELPGRGSDPMGRRRAAAQPKVRR